MACTRVTALGLALGLALLLGLAGPPDPAPRAASPNATPTPTAEWEGCRVAVTPAAPTTRDAVRIAVAGVWTDTCVPEYASHCLSGHRITVDFTHVVSPGACLPVLWDWGHTVEVGPLPHGVYTATARINSVACGQEVFAVRPEMRGVHLPLVAREWQRG